VTLQGAVTLISLFGPPAFGFYVFRRGGRSWLRSFIDSLYIFAVCMMVLMGLILVHKGLGLFGESVLFALPFLIVVCLWVLMAPHFNARK
jgi:hypothetical protein